MQTGPAESPDRNTDTNRNTRRRPKYNARMQFNEGRGKRALSRATLDRNGLD
jgi:hypothetical protein